MYKIREGVELPKTFKIRVTPEQSEALQKYLFSKGINWLSGAKRPLNTERPFLYVRVLKLEYGTTLDFFTDDTSPEIRFSDYFKQDCKKVASASTKIRRFLAENTDFIKSFSIKANSCGFTDYKVEVCGRIVLGCFREDDDKAAESYITRIKRHLVTDDAITNVMKFLQKHHTKINAEYCRPHGGTELQIKAEIKDKGVSTSFNVTLYPNEMGKANTFISTVSAVLGLNPVGLKAHELARENAILKSDLETAKKFDRNFYKRRMAELRKKIYELTKAKQKNIPAKWCIKVTDKNRDKLNDYLQKNSSKYEGFYPAWKIESKSIYFYSESPELGCHSHCILFPGFQLIKTKDLKHFL